ncbi:MAG TPA: peroxidase [Vicinamibacteria bacterium]|nr:peroxidase [Vicinamibacteria bacterium]
MDAVLEDHWSSPLSDKEKALFDLVEKANRVSNQIRREDLDRARSAGWTDEALYDAITVCALFNFYNLWIDATGVHEMPAAGYEASGKRLATEGYAPMNGKD